MKIFTRLICQHEWRILSSTLTESQLEQANKLGLNITKVRGYSILEKKMIQIVTCHKCGKIKQYVTDI